MVYYKAINPDGVQEFNKNKERKVTYLLSQFPKMLNLIYFDYVPKSVFTNSTHFLFVSLKERKIQLVTSFYQKSRKTEFYRVQGLENEI